MIVIDYVTVGLIFSAAFTGFATIWGVKKAIQILL